MLSDLLWLPKFTVQVLDKRGNQAGEINNYPVVTDDLASFERCRENQSTLWQSWLDKRMTYLLMLHRFDEEEWRKAWNTVAKCI